MKYLKYLFFFLVILIPVLSQGQSKKEEKLRREADWLFEVGDYVLALEEYEQLLGIDSSNAYYWYKAGLCFVHSYSEQDLALQYFEIAARKNGADDIPDLFYLLARAYHEANRFQEAIQMYTRFLGTIKESYLLADLEVVVNREIEKCNYGKVMMSSPIEVVIENLEGVNTVFPEYAPVIFNDESKLIFTSRREGSTGDKVDVNGDYYEDIYITDLITDNKYAVGEEEKMNKGNFVSLLSKFQFSEPKHISSNINTSIHDAAISLTPDNKRLFLYHNYKVWYSDYNGQEWSKKKKFSAVPINDKNFVPSLAISADESTLFIVSDRPGGFGGTDIYMSKKKENGVWGKLINLGPTINTPEDEDAPYIDPDGKTLYFASKGHSSMGGYDIYKTVLEEGIWQFPKNMGYPLNSGGDDIFLVFTPRHNRGYYSSNRPGGYGNMDLYRVTFAHERTPLAELKGLVLEGDSLLPSSSVIYVYDSTGTDITSEFRSDPSSGKYLILLPHGEDYKIRVETDGFAPYEKVFDIPKAAKYYTFYQEIHHVHLKDKKGNIIGQKVSLNNAYFDLKEVLKKNPAEAFENDTVLADRTDIYRKYLKAQEEGPEKAIDTTSSDSLDVTEAPPRFKLEASEIKFYISEDSLRSIITEDTSILSDIGEIEETELQFFEPDDTVKTIEHIEAYVPPRKIELSKPTIPQPGNEAIADNGTNTGEEKPVVAKKVTSANAVKDSKIYFDFDKTELTADELQKLRQIAAFLGENKGVKIEVQGHTDSKGPEGYNKILSERRARQVYKLLLKEGASKDQVSVQGYGEERPVAPNTLPDGSDNIEGRKLNRRVEFKIISQ